MSRQMNYVPKCTWCQKSYCLHLPKVRKIKTYLIILLVTDPNTRTLWGWISCFFTILIPFIQSGGRSQPRWVLRTWAKPNTPRSKCGSPTKAGSHGGGALWWRWQGRVPHGEAGILLGTLRSCVFRKMSNNPSSGPRVMGTCTHGDLIKMQILI
jgi:hypothetical protein